MLFVGLLLAICCFLISPRLSMYFKPAIEMHKRFQSNVQ